MLSERFGCTAKAALATTLLAWLLPLCACSSTAAPASAPAPRRIEAPVGSTLAAFAVPKGKFAVYVFVTTDCPIANSYAPWIAQFAHSLRDTPVAVSLVHVDPDISAEQAQQHARDYELDLPILLDPDQVLAHAVGATVTPMAAVLSAQGLEYLGRIDDRWPRRGVDGQVAANHDLHDAVHALLRGESVPNPRTDAVGCRLPQRAL